MEHKLPSLPHAKDALTPYMSEETLDYHNIKRHQIDVSNLNKLILATEFEYRSLEEIVRSSSGGVFNNAAQVWNHRLFWSSLAPQGRGEPGGVLADAINGRWNTLTAFRQTFAIAAVSNSGSGWTWLVKGADGSLDIVSTSNAATPISSDFASAHNDRRMGTRLLHRLSQRAPNLRRYPARQPDQLAVR